MIRSKARSPHSQIPVGFKRWQQGFGDVKLSKNQTDPWRLMGFWPQPAIAGEEVERKHEEKAVTPKARTRHWPVFPGHRDSMSAPEALKGGVSHPFGEVKD